MEFWKDINGYEGFYQVSTFGNIKSLNFNHSGKEKNLKPRDDNYGYYKVVLFRNGEKQSKRVHRLVAQAFLPNYYNKPEVDHINRIRSDNRLINLRWVTKIENSMNLTKQENTSSQYIGVSWEKLRKKWTANIRLNGKKKTLGRFNNEYEAHLAYQHALQEKKKEFYPNL